MLSYHLNEKEGHFYFDKFSFDKGDFTILQIYLQTILFVYSKRQNDFKHVYCKVQLKWSSII